MSIESYAGVPGVAVDIEVPKDIHEALDEIHSQTMDMEATTKKDKIRQNKALLILSKAMDDIEKLYGYFEE